MIDVISQTIVANSFQRTMLGLDLGDGATPESVDLFSRATVEQWAEVDPTKYGYLFAQVFEPDVLRELALLEGISDESVVSLGHRPSESMSRLAAMVADTSASSTVELVGLASVLISISRFKVAAGLLDQARLLPAQPWDRFEIAMLDFMISNRCRDGQGSSASFESMRAAVATGSVAPDRTMDCCTQAVVWYLKRGELSRRDFTWFLETGQQIIRTIGPRLDPASVSSWFRALAMIPAATGDARTTRDYMNRAREAAEDTLSRRPRAYEMHLMKTYYESSLKEHLYLTRDLDQAVEAGRALIALDPAWAPSFGELAEVYVAFGRHSEAADLYDRAVAVGPPYVGLHLVRSAKSRMTSGQDEQALVAFTTLAGLAPDSDPVHTIGYPLARKLGLDPVAHFGAAAKQQALRRRHP